MAGRCMANAGRRSLRRPRPNDNLWALLRAQLDRLEPREEETVSAPEPEPWRPYRVGRMDEFLGSEVAQKDTRHATPQTRLEVGNRPVTDEDVERALAAQAALRTLVRKAEADAEVRVRSPPHASRRPTLLPQLPQLPPPPISPGGKASWRPDCGRSAQPAAAACDSLRRRRCACPARTRPAAGLEPAAPGLRDRRRGRSAWPAEDGCGGCDGEQSGPMHGLRDWTAGGYARGARGGGGGGGAARGPQ